MRSLVRWAGWRCGLSSGAVMPVGISLDEIARLHPVLYHMAEAGSWPSIEQHGLLSTTALLDLYGVLGAERDKVESECRSRSMQISGAPGQAALVRDQKTLSDKKLLSCLDAGLNPADWYRKLNGKVFFSVVPERLAKLMSAYRDRQHLVLELDARQLLACYSDAVMLAPLNTGCVRSKDHKRGHDTFLPPAQYAFAEHRRRKGGARKAIVELTVQGKVQDVKRFLNRASLCMFVGDGMRTIETVYERPQREVGTSAPGESGRFALPV